mmetsp:Transcript_27510/g.48625  ORF Transcript_27510/g.48625 Transcript_27510/m.48625 type:complete len:232 (+) Transcript_27510:71-766(+)
MNRSRIPNESPSAGLENPITTSPRANNNASPRSLGSPDRAPTAVRINFGVNKTLYTDTKKRGEAQVQNKMRVKEFLFDHGFSHPWRHPSIWYNFLDVQNSRSSYMNLDQMIDILLGGLFRFLANPKIDDQTHGETLSVQMEDVQLYLSKFPKSYRLELSRRVEARLNQEGYSLNQDDVVSFNTKFLGDLFQPVTKGLDDDCGTGSTSVGGTKGHARNTTWGQMGKKGDTMV